MGIVIVSAEEIRALHHYRDNTDFGVSSRAKMKTRAIGSKFKTRAVASH
jgi:hypothetical protein